MPYRTLPYAATAGYRFYLQIMGELTFETVQADLAPIRKLLLKKGGVIINGGEVTTCDGAGIQLLCTLISELERQQRPIMIEQISHELDEAGLRYGIDFMSRYSSAPKNNGGINESS